MLSFLSFFLLFTSSSLSELDSFGLCRTIPLSLSYSFSSPVNKFSSDGICLILLAGDIEEILDMASRDFGMYDDVSIVKKVSYIVNFEVSMANFTRNTGT